MVLPVVPSFNTAGACIPGEHYMLPPERRLGRILKLIDERKYFTLQSGRQTGKTTSAQWLAEHYNAGDRYRAMWVDVQAAREEPDPAAAFLTVREALDRAVRMWLDDVGVPTGAARSLEDPKTVVQRYTTATGQRFEPEAIAAIYDLSQGHPWLVNALADRIVERDLTDRTAPVTAAHVEAAKEAIILERRTHIDSLMAKLREPRVRRIIDTMIAGGQTEPDVLDDDFAYVLGLGLVRVHGGQFEIANPIYREVIPRALTYIRQMQIANDPADYVRPDGALDMAKLMTDWQTFWREDGHLAAAGFGYRESGPHLMLMAFLQRVINGGGRIMREYGLGRGALDLVVDWRGKRHAIEVKLRRDTQTETRALAQTARYMDTLQLDEGWLVMFDLRAKRSWKQRMTSKTVKKAGKRIHLIGC